MPALLNRMSMPPKARRTSSAASWQSLFLRTSVGMKTAWPPIFVICSVTAWPRVSLRPVIAIFAPSFANRIAVASPMPEVPPVMSATLFCNRMFQNSSPEATANPPSLRRPLQVLHRLQMMPHRSPDTALLAQSPPACQVFPTGDELILQETALRVRPVAEPHCEAWQCRCLRGRCSLREYSAAHDPLPWLS